MIKLGVIGYGSRMHGMINDVFREIEPQIQVKAVIDPDNQLVHNVDDGIRIICRQLPALGEVR